MRCPKCGFISFDHLDTCLKCNKDIAGTSDTLNGSVYNVAAPTFLKFSATSEDDEVDLDEAFVVDDDGFMDEEIRDPDLDILLDEPSEDEEDFEISMGKDEPEPRDRKISRAESAEEEGSISFNLDEFDDEVDLGDADHDQDEFAEKPLKMGFPEELSDISDLEPPPALKEVAEEPVAAASEDDFDLDLDFDLNLDAEDLAPASSGAKESALADFSLNELDLDEELPSMAPSKKTASEKMDLDNLNFDLDLGDLHLDDDEKI